MNALPPPPTLDQRRALDAYLAARREAIHHAERAPRSLHRVALNTTPQRRSQDAAMAAERSLWQAITDECRTARKYIVEDFRTAPAQVTAAVLVLLVLSGIGMVLVAVKHGWIS
jgi:hypothetical protein